MFQDRPFTAKSYNEFIKEKKLMGNKCEECKNLMIPPRILCTECRGNRLKWFQLKGTGSLETFTIVHVAPTFLKEKAPYAVGIVKLDEGPFLTARLVNFNVKLPETIKIGTHVTADFLEENGKLLLVFKPT